MTRTGTKASWIAVMIAIAAMASGAMTDETASDTMTASWQISAGAPATTIAAPACECAPETGMWMDAAARSCAMADPAMPGIGK